MKRNQDLSEGDMGEEAALPAGAGAAEPLAAEGRALAELRERLELYSRAANDGLFDWDLARDQVRYSERWRRILGLPGGEEEQAVGAWLDRVHPEDAGHLRRQIELHLSGRSPLLEVEHRLLHGRGDYRWVLVRALAQRDAAGRPRRLAGSLTDLTQRRNAEEQVARSALHDPLTFLPNRLFFTHRVARAIQAGGRSAYAVLLLDLDRFHRVNARLGHTVGDQVLVTVGRRIAECLRPGEVLARIGNDEFGVLLDEVGEPRSLMLLAERVQREVSRPLRAGVEEIAVSASAGLVLGRPDYRRPEELLRDAETALARARSLGRAKLQLFDPRMQERAAGLLRLEAELQRALQRGELELHYQPLVALPAGRLAGCEALVRWRHAERGLIPPAEFLDLAEETGLIVPIGELALQTACGQVRRWLDSGLRCPPVSVNLSARQLRDRRLPRFLSALLEEHLLPAELLKLEVTETAVAEDPEEAGEILAQLAGLGVALVLDDFGTGHSSLGQLRRFPFHAMKIDRSFVLGLPEDPAAAAIARAVVQLAHGLRLCVVAEGVESALQGDFLAEIGCDQAQGFLFGPPAPAAAFEELLAEARA